MFKCIAFFGASTGCGLAALKLALADGHTCIALCRNQAKFDAIFPNKPANLILHPGNAHDEAAVKACIINPYDATRFVDNINFSIGGAFSMSSMSIDDPDVCRKGMTALLASIKTLRQTGVAGQPLITAITSTGISKHQRDVPVGFLLMYKVMLKTPHVDKKKVEEALEAATSERWVIVRPSFLGDDAHPERPIRVGVEDPQNGVEQKAVGYFISRPDVGRWMYHELLKGDAKGYVGKAVGLTW